MRVHRQTASALASAALMCVLLLLAAACTASQADRTGLPTCGRKPKSSPVVAGTLRLHLSAPDTARAGTRLHPKVTITAADATVGVTNGSQPADILIVRAGKVVGRYEGPVGGSGFVATVSRRPTPVPNYGVLLSGCPRGPVSSSKPDVSRRALPPYRYSLVAVMGFASRHGNRLDAILLVSPAQAIHVVR